jgi:hypothetical protein
MAKTLDYAIKGLKYGLGIGAAVGAVIGGVAIAAAVAIGAAHAIPAAIGVALISTALYGFHGAFWGAVVGGSAGLLSDLFVKNNEAPPQAQPQIIITRPSPAISVEPAIYQQQEQASTRWQDDIAARRAAGTVIVR